MNSTCFFPWHRIALNFFNFSIGYRLTWKNIRKSKKTIVASSRRAAHRRKDEKSRSDVSYANKIVFLCNHRQKAARISFVLFRCIFQTLSIEMCIKPSVVWRFRPSLHLDVNFYLGISIKDINNWKKNPKISSYTFDNKLADQKTRKRRMKIDFSAKIERHWPVNVWF